MDGVVLVDLAARYGGAETRVVQTATGLAGRGVPVEVVCLAGGPLPRRLTDTAGVTVTPLASRRGDPRLVRALARVFARRPGWVVDAHSVHSQLWSMLACRLANRPIVFTVHSDYAAEHAGRLRARPYTAVLRIARARGVRVVAVSESVRRALVERGKPRAPVVVVPNAIAFAARDGARGELRASLGVTDDEFLVSCVARLEPVKGHDVLIEAMAAAVRQRPELRLVIVGYGPARGDVEAAIAKHDLRASVSMLGFRDDVADLLVASDATVLASFTEGIPMALLEAAAAGTPIVATAVGGVPTVFSESSALLVEARSARALAAALVEVATDAALRERRAAEARRVVERDFDVAAMLDRLLAVYRDVADH